MVTDKCRHIFAQSVQPDQLVLFQWGKYNKNWLNAEFHKKFCPFKIDFWPNKMKIKFEVYYEKNIWGGESFNDQ